MAKPLRARRLRDDEAMMLVAEWRAEGRRMPMAEPDRLECRCSTRHPIVAMQINGGQHHFRAFCGKTNILGDRSYSRAYVGNGIVGEEIPELVNPGLARCARCGTHGAELHHWAPQALFDDAHFWPMSRLCRQCHMLWHSVVTPSLVSGLR